MKTIQSVTHEGITYLDDEGESKFIDLIACNKKWIAEFAATGNEVDPIEYTYLGFRNFCAKPPHILLLSEPETKFEFEADANGYAVGFDKLLWQLKQVGWRTFDGC